MMRFRNASAGTFARALALVALSVACHHDDPAPSSTSDNARDAQMIAPMLDDAGNPVAAVPVVPPCTFAGEPVALTGGALAVGDGVRDGSGAGEAGNGGATFGVLRTSGAAAWAHVDASGASLVMHDLPLSDPDAPPPRILARGDERFVLYSQSGAKKSAPRVAVGSGAAPGTGARLDNPTASLMLVFARLSGGLAVASGADAGAETLATVASQRDDSLDSDVAFGPSGGLVVWDEDEPFARFGVIRAARLDASGHLSGAPFTVTSEASDADAPRVFAAVTGFVIVYRSRRVEDRDAGLYDNSPEGPGERRAFHWLEAINVDASGATDAGAAGTNLRRLTSPTGHAGSFDAFSRSPEAVDILVHDDDAPKDAAGSRISRIRLPVSGSEVGAAVPLVASGAGAGAVSFLDAVPACGGACDAIVFAGDDDGARMVRGAASAASLPVATREPAFDGSDPVVRLPSGGVLVFVRDHGGSVRTVTCH